MTSSLNNSSNNSSSVRERFKNIANKHSISETPKDFLTRNISQLGARAAETLVGLPGNLKKAFQESLRSFEPFALGEGESLEESEKKAFGEPEKGSVHELLLNPPTSSELRESVTPLIAEKITGKKDYLEPKSKGEKFAGELTEDLTSFFIPGTGQMRLAVRLGAPIVGNLAKEGVKFLGGNEELAQKTKLGFMMATTLAGQSNPGRFARERIAEAKNSIPQNATANVTNLIPRLAPLMRRLVRGLQVPSKSRAIQGIQQLNAQIQNGRMSLHSLMDARDNINEWISEAGGWDVPTNTRDAAVANLNELKTQVIKTIDENLQSRFPQAADLYRTGYEAAAVTHRSNAISNFIEKNFGKKTAAVGTKLLFPSLAGGAALIPKTAGIAAASLPLYKSGQVLYRIAKSPTLAEYYRDVITHSLKGNAPAMVKSMEKLDKALAEDEKKRGIIDPANLEEFKKKFKKKG